MKKIFTLIAFLSMVMGANAEEWFVSGSGAILNGETWKHNSEKNKMTEQADGTFQLVVTDAVLETGTAYEWLVVNKAQSTWVKDGGNNYKITVTETGKYKIVYTLAADHKSASAAVTKTGEAGPVSHTYTVAGVKALMGTNWDPADTSNDMALQGDGTYKLVKTGRTLAAAAYTYKVAVDHDWGEAYPANDAVLTIDEAGVYDVTFTFNPTNKNVNAVAEKKGDANIEESYVVVGDNATLFGVTWDDPDDAAINAEANKMTKQDDGNWKKVYTNVDLPACTILWKLVHNGVTWIPDNNQTLEIAEAGKYTITFTYIVEDQEPQAEAVKTGESSVKGVTVVNFDSEKIYDLQGRRVMNAQKGLYIVNGKKLICR